MTDAQHFLKYAAECLAFANAAKTDDESKVFLDMARSWTEAAMQIEDKLSIPKFLDPQSPPLMPD
jgi:hypothetical protein